MINKYTLITFLVCCFNSFSQEIVNSTPVELKKDIQVFEVVNDSTKQVTMFFADKNRIKVVRLDDKMKFIDSVSVQKPEKNYTQMIGNVVSGNKTTLFWASSNKKNILAQSFDSQNNKISDKKNALEFKNEVYLKEFSLGNKFLILSLLKKSSIFKLYVFNSKGNLEIKDIDLSKNKFYHRSDLYETFGETIMPFDVPFSLEKINSNSPSSLVSAAKKRKCYTLNNQIIITIDTDINYTQVIAIDLEKYTATSKSIVNTSYSKFSQDDYDLKSNSFLIYNKLYQIKSTTDKFYMTIKDLNETLLKEYSATDETTIDFKNSDINQEGTDFGNGKKTLDKSSQFIRKLNHLSPAISCYQVGDNTLMTMGGVSDNSSGSYQAVSAQFGLVGLLIYAAVTSPTMENFHNVYANRKIVKIEGLFDKNGNHVKGDLQPVAFDKILTFFENNKKTSSQILFKVDTLYYVGYYDKDAKEYIIRKFADGNN